MATHSSVLAWRILGTAEPGGLQSMGSHRVGHDWRDLAAVAPAGLAYKPFELSHSFCKLFKLFESGPLLQEKKNLRNEIQVI